MTTPNEPNLVELLRGRLEIARDRVWHSTDSDEVPGLLDALADVADAIGDDDETANHPAVQAVARALLAPVDDLCETSRPMVQRIVDGEFGQDAAGAVAHLLMLLADTRGQVQGLERALSARDTAPEEQVATEWCVFADSADPNDEKAYIGRYSTRHRAEGALFALDLSDGGGVAFRTVNPWQVVTTEDGQS